MDPIEVFKKVIRVLQPQNAAVFEGQIDYNDTNIITINGKLMMRRHDGYVPLESDRTFNTIKNCIEQRKRNPELFICRCGHCSAVLLGQLYNNLYRVPTRKTDEEILEESFKETEASLQPQAKVPAVPTAATSLTSPILTAQDVCTLPFGKYKGRSFRDIFYSDRPYCIWCIESAAIERSKGGAANISAEMSLFVSYIKSKLYSL